MTNQALVKARRAKSNNHAALMIGHLHTLYTPSHTSTDRPDRLLNAPLTHMLKTLGIGAYAYIKFRVHTWVPLSISDLVVKISLGLQTPTRTMVKAIAVCTNHQKLLDGTSTGCW